MFFPAFFRSAGIFLQKMLTTQQKRDKIFFVELSTKRSDGYVRKI